MWNAVLIPLFIIAVAIVPTFLVYYQRDQFFRQKFVPIYKRKTMLGTIINKVNEEIEDHTLSTRHYRGHVKSKMNTYVVTFQTEERTIEFLTRRSIYDSLHIGDYGEISYYKSYFYKLKKREKPSKKEEDVFDQYLSK